MATFPTIVITENAGSYQPEVIGMVKNCQSREPNLMGGSRTLTIIGMHSIRIIKNILLQGGITMSMVIKTSENGSIHIYESTEEGKGHVHAVI